MPRGDRTGPMGMGPMTGRAAGFCAGYGTPGFANQPGMGRPRRGGRGLGRGYGRGFGRGYGAGYGGWDAISAASPAPANPTSVPDEQADGIDQLRSQLDQLQQTMEQLRAQVEQVSR